MRSRCDNPERIDTGQPCGKPACWIVRVGSRESDRQCSCGDCLPYTADVMYEGEGREGARVTLERLHDR